MQAGKPRALMAQVSSTSAHRCLTALLLLSFLQPSFNSIRRADHSSQSTETIFSSIVIFTSCNTLDLQDAL